MDHLFSSSHLPPEPAPPRAVIIERLPPLPPKPRDIIIERWLPYEIVNQKRKVIVERVRKTSKEYLQPKNVIITYVFTLRCVNDVYRLSLDTSQFMPKSNGTFKNKMLSEKIHNHMPVVLVNNYAMPIQ